MVFCNRCICKFCLVFCVSRLCYVVVISPSFDSAKIIINMQTGKFFVQNTFILTFNKLVSGRSCTLRAFFMMSRCFEKGQTGLSARERFRRMDPLSSVVRADCGCRACSLGGVWKNEGGCRADCRQVLNVLRSDLY